MKFLKPILVFGGVYSAGILATLAVTNWNTALGLAVDIGVLVCLGLLIWPLAKMGASAWEEADE